MKKIEKLPVGLGMFHLELEIAICKDWNHRIDHGIQPSVWRDEESAPPNLFLTATESGDNLVSGGFVEREGGVYRLTPKAVAALEAFSEK